MNLIDALLVEHGLFYVMFDELERLLPNLRTSGEVSSAAATLAKTLISHAELENNVLFPILEEVIGPMGPLAVMRAEHEEIDGSLQGLASIEDCNVAADTLSYVLEIARSHFSKEEQVLFPMARQVLDEQHLLELGACWLKMRLAPAS